MTWIESEVRWHMLHHRTKTEMLERIRSFPASHRLIGHAMMRASAMWDLAVADAQEGAS